MSLSMTVAAILTAWLCFAVAVAGLLAAKRDTERRSADHERRWSR